VTIGTGAAVAGVELIGPADAQFEASVESLWGKRAGHVLHPALPFSVLAVNKADRTAGLLGVRFDMENRDGKTYSVVHYADTLRNPEKADLAPGAMRFVCAEPRYTNLVLRRELTVDPRGAMNLENLRKARRMSASIDCVAFTNGQFAGPDTLGAFDRLERERVAGESLVAAVLASDSEARIGTLLEAAMAQPDERTIARQIYTELVAGGAAAAQSVAKLQKRRIRLWR